MTATEAVSVIQTFMAQDDEERKRWKANEPFQPSKLLQSLESAAIHAADCIAAGELEESTYDDGEDCA